MIEYTFFLNIIPIVKSYYSNKNYFWNEYMLCLNNNRLFTLEISINLLYFCSNN